MTNFYYTNISIIAILGMHSDRLIFWNLIVLSVIILSTFVIPYEILVHRASPYLDSIFYLVFGMDILVKCNTPHEKKYSGLFGWRNFASLVNKKYSVSAIKQKQNIQLTKQPQIIKSYLSSGWFIIDLLAVIPFQFIFGGFSYLGLIRATRLTGLSRILRLIPAIRAIKSFNLIHIFSNIFVLHPAMGRFVKISFLVPWLAHIHACLLFYFESTEPTSQIQTFQNALHFIFVSFTTYDFTPTVTRSGYAVCLSAIIFGYIFFGLFMGNFASMFGEMDQNQKNYEREKTLWTRIFKNDPIKFNRELQKKILENLKEQHSFFNVQEVEAELISALPAYLEKEIRDNK